MASASEVAISPSKSQRHEGLGIDYIERPGLPDLIELTRRRLPLTPDVFASTTREYSLSLFGHTIRIEVSREATPEAESLKQVELFANELKDFLRQTQSDSAEQFNEADKFESWVGQWGRDNIQLIGAFLRGVHSVRNLLLLKSPFVKGYTEDYGERLSKTIQVITRSIESVEQIKQQLTDREDDFSTELRSILDRVLVDLRALSTSFTQQLTTHNAIRSLLGYSDMRSTL